MTTIKPERNTTRLNSLLDIEKKIKSSWDKEKPFEIDAPLDTTKPKYFITFPYPYMNGRLHLGHAFSLTKTEFAARFHKLLGESVLYPFGFHCTGMPIVAAANKLKREMLDFGCPPVFPSEEDAVEKVVVVKEVVVGNFSSNKGKDKAKKGSIYQWNIMKGMGIPEEMIPKFADPTFWVSYFPPLGKEDLVDFGSAIDFRRSFVTTDVNPFYDSFIRWQFNRLKEGGFITFQKRFSVYSTTDKQPCADHERSEGEGVKPQVYTLIKMQVQSPFPKCLEAFSGKKVYLAPVTLRPETMYGQTNCWILPEGEYGAYEMNKDEVIICTDRSALNMAYQEAFETFGVVKKLATLKGQELIGTKVSAPYSAYSTVYVLPMLSVSTFKGTGIVTSVPSDSPDDWMSFKLLKTKKDFREKFGVTDEMVLPFDVIPIINIPDISDLSAVTICEKLKIVSANDKEKLTEAKEIVYNKGFYDGTLIVGTHKGKKVKEAKDLVQAELIKDGLGFKYAEPESLVKNRENVECVVALTDQWFIKYGEDEWQKKVHDHTKNVLETYNPGTKNLLLGTIAWLKDWACSREYGLGTKLPFDERYLIESLSDSTIYMAYYTFAHILQNGTLEGDRNGPVKPEHLTQQVWDYILIDGKYPTDSKIDEKILATMKHEFKYWYGVDLRTSGKDLIQNHLTMFLYNHAAIFEPKLWPKAIYANGHVLVDGDKMSKSKGNFLLLGDTIKNYSCDATRIALADAGDGLDDANFLRQTADDSILKLTTYLTWVSEVLTQNLRSGEPDTFADRSFEHRMRAVIANAKKSYATMHFREALRFAWYDMQKCKDDYKVDVDTNGLHGGLIRQFFALQAVIMSPITPHISQHIWELLGNKDFTKQTWPVLEEPDVRTIRSYFYYQNSIHDFRVKLEKEEEMFKKKNKGVAFVKPIEATIFIATEYADWQKKTLEIVRDVVEKEKTIPKDIAGILKKSFTGKDELTNCMTFVATLKVEFEKYGIDALKAEVPFDERKIMTENINLLIKGLAVNKVTIFGVTDKDIVDPNKRAPLASTGRPQITFGYPK